jgi:hypothetical protein
MYCLEQLWQRAYIAAIQTLSAYPGEEVEGLSLKANCARCWPDR